ncbi:MAG: type II secretion system F family protein [archaeon]
MKFIYLEEFGKAFIPKRIRPGLRKYMMKAGITEVPFKFFGVLFYISVLLTGIVYLKKIFPALSEKEAGSLVFLATTFAVWVGIQLAILAIFMVSIHVYLDMKILQRTKQMELVLIDFLRYVSENLKGGMSLDRALWDAIRPKFGVLATEIRLVAKRVMTGQDVEQALGEFTDKYDSPMLRRSFNLIIEGVKGGSRIADLIDKIEANLRETKELKDEINAANLSHVIFLTAISLVVAPALYGLSYNLLIILKDISAKLGSGVANPNSPIQISEITIDPADFVRFSMWALGVTAGFGAMILSVIRYGNIKQGLKYIPPYVIIALIMYTVFRAVTSLVFGGMIT